MWVHLALRNFPTFQVQLVLVYNSLKEFDVEKFKYARFASKLLP